MKKLMAILAHPDDEGIVAGTLTHYANNDCEVMLVCATRGEVGEISEAAQAQSVTAENLAQVRQKEMEKACEILGIQYLEFLRYRDSGMEGTPENEDSRALVQADTAEFTKKIVSLIRNFQPDAVITFEPFGWYGHPDHRFVSQWVTAAFPMAGDESAYPEAGPIWQPDKLFHSVLPFTKFRAMMEKALEAGYIEENGFNENIPEDLLLSTEAAVTHILDMESHFDTKTTAMAAHLTQFGEDNLFSRIPREWGVDVMGREYFIQVYPARSAKNANSPETNLFN